jgi:hypothetical protein
MIIVCLIASSFPFAVPSPWFSTVSMHTGIRHRSREFMSSESTSVDFRFDFGWSRGLVTHSFDCT